jgi:hypothetical protein
VSSKLFCQQLLFSLGHKDYTVPNRNLSNITGLTQLLIV